MTKNACVRDDNLYTILVHPEDEVDYEAVNRVLPILIERHLLCTPSADCMSDALSRENI